MTKIALLGDSHFGVHRSNITFADNMSNFLRQVFFPYIRSRGITDIVHLGDLVDSRRGISFHTMNRITTDFVHPVVDNHLNCYILAGNHDAPYKNTLEHNAVRELLGGREDNFEVFDGPSCKVLRSTSVAMLPWLCDENRESTSDLLNATDVRVVFGHLELNGYPMHAGRECEDGREDKKFQTFDLVVTGHFHERSRKGVVQYLGAPCEYTWADAGCKRGFGVLDLETLEIEFVDNPFTMFETLFYDDGVSQEDMSLLFNKMVRVVVKKKSSQSDFDRTMKLIEDTGPLSLKIVEGHVDLTADDVDIDDSYDDDPTKIFGDYLASMQESQGLKKKEVERILRRAYDESHLLWGT